MRPRQWERRLLLVTKQRRLSNLSFVLLALVILLCVNWLWQNDNHVDQLEYSQVRQLFLQEKVTGLTIDSGPGAAGAGERQRDRAV